MTASDATQLTMIAPLPALRKRTRLAKMVPAFLDHGLTVNFLGWERESGEADALDWGDARVGERLILRGGGYASGRARLMYPIWMIAVFWAVLRLGRNKAVFCLGWETAFPARLAAFFTGSKIVFDDADRFSLILKLPGVLNRVLVRLERWASYNCLVHIVPGWSRYEWRHDRMMVLRNSPSSEDLQRALASAPQDRKGDLVVYANGWLGHTRGAPIILKAVNEAQNLGLPIHVHIAGRLDSEDGKALTEHPLVTFHGEVPQYKALALYAASDLVLTLYDPAVTINRQAESNKWGDCVFFETPFVVNSEVETARAFVQRGAAFSFAYNDATALTAIFRRFVESKADLESAKAKIAMFKDDYPVFDFQLPTLIAQIKAVSS